MAQIGSPAQIASLASYHVYYVVNHNMYYSWTIEGGEVPQLYSTRTTYVLLLFDRYVLRTSDIRQVRTKNRFSMQPGICVSVKIQILF